MYKVRRILTIHMTATKENGERQQCLISKKTTLHVQHTYFVHFFCRCFARLQRETSRNFLVTRFMEEMSYVFSFTFFFHCRSISPSALVAASISYFLTATTKLSCCSSNKKNVSFISLTRSLLPFFWLSFAGLPPTFSFSLSFSTSIFQICGRDS